MARAHSQQQISLLRMRMSRIEVKRRALILEGGQRLAKSDAMLSDVFSVLVVVPLEVDFLYLFLAYTIRSPAAAVKT